MNPGNSAPAVVWLASDDSKPITGQVLRMVGNSLCVYQPWEMGEEFFATDTEGNPTQWDPADDRPHPQQVRLPHDEPRHRCAAEALASAGWHTDFETLLYEERDGVAWVTLNRPERPQRVQLADAARAARRCGAACGATTTCAASSSPAPARRRSAPASTAWSRWAARPTTRTDPDVVGSRPHAVHVQRPRRQHRPEELRPLEAGDRGRERHGLRRRLLHARRGRVHHRRRARHVLRPARHLRHDGGVRADPHVRDHAVRRDHAAVAPRQPRAPVGAARAYEIGLVSEVVPGDAAARAPPAWARERDRLRSRSLAIEGTVRAIWGARELGSRQALRLGYAYVGMGTSQDSIAEGQKLFESGQAHRVEAPLSGGTADAGRDRRRRAVRLRARRRQDRRSSSTTRPRAAPSPTPASTKDDVDGFALLRHGTARAGRGRRVPRAAARPGSTAPASAARTWEFMVEHADGGDPGRPRRGRRARRTARRRAPTSSAAAPRQPRVRQPRARSSSTCRSATRSSPSTRWRPAGTCTSSAPRSSSSPRSRCRPATTPALNPDAYYRDPITIDDVQTPPMIADPFTKLHCCIRSDGGGAVVLTSRGAGPRPAPSAPVWVLGTGEAVSPHDDERVGRLHRVAGACARARSRSSAPASPRPTSTCCQIYDAFTSMVLLTLEALGFCGKGEGGPFVEDGKLRVGGALPDQHRRRRALGVPPRDARHVPARRGGAASCAARPAAGRSPDAELALRQRHRRLVLAPPARSSSGWSRNRGRGWAAFGLDRTRGADRRRRRPVCGLLAASWYARDRAERARRRARAPGRHPPGPRAGNARR